ncbi:hypothetical protein HY745_04590 [Candidatus Desantisbacteria bacterium]|nr:hypothetical protein [Candidatus Desantisbacteria bacterium]
MTISEKNELLDKMSTCYNKINYLKTIAEEKNEIDTASQLEIKKKELKTEIDKLLRDSYLNWDEFTAELNNKLTNLNKKLEQCIKEIVKNINFVQNIVKAVGYIDDIIKVAKKIK